MDETIKSGEQTSLPPMPDAVSALLSNPALLQGLGAALGMTPQGGASTDKPEGAASPPAIDGLSALLSNPQALEKLPQIIAALRPLMETIPPPVTVQEAVETSVLPSPMASRDQLLLAIKPFLSHERCEAVDTILRLSKLGAIFKQIK